MTLEEKRAFVKAYCHMRDCDEDSCVVKKLNDAEGINVCHSNATEKQLDERINIIKKEKDANMIPLMMKRDKCLDFCNERKNCKDCPVRKIAVENYDDECDFNIFSEKDINECLKLFEASVMSGGECSSHDAAPAAEAEPVDNVHPQHYKLPNGMEVIDVEVAMFGREAVMHHCFCTAAEYILRHMQKNGVEDIKKAHWWLEKYIELEASE